MRYAHHSRRGLFAAYLLALALAACGGDGNGNAGDGDGDGNDRPDGQDDGSAGDGASDGDPGDGTSDGDPGDGTSDGDPGDGASDGDPGDGTSDGNPGDGSDAEGDYTLDVSDMPFVAAFTSDTEHAVTKLVPRAGDTLTATAADGTVYELVVPAGALVDPVEITMTPLASLSVEGLPFERSAGVSFEPEGLQFLTPATLTMTPPSGTEWPVFEQLPIGFDGAAHHVSLALLQKTDDVRFSLLHFSSYALLLARTGVNATLEPARHRLGGSESDRITSAIGELLTRERQAQLLGQADGGDTIEGLDALIDEYYEKVVKVRVAAASESCAYGRLALQTYLTFERQNQLLGRDTSGYYDANMLTAKLIGESGTACMREEHALCVDEHIVTRVLPVFLSFLRQAALLGLVDESGYTPSWLYDAEEYVRKCLQFELQMDGSVTYGQTSPPSHSLSEHVSSRVPIRYGISFLEPLPDAPPDLRDFQALLSGDLTTMTASGLSVYYSEDCTMSGGETLVSGELGVAFMTFQAGTGSVADRARLEDVSLSVAFSPNLSTHELSWGRRSGISCVDYNDSTETESFGTLAVPLLSERYVTDNGGVLIGDWTVASGSDIPATKEIRFNAAPEGGAEGNVVVEVSFVLFHEPAE